jgi:hypothetical protein
MSSQSSAYSSRAVSPALMRQRKSNRNKRTERGKRGSSYSFFVFVFAFLIFLVIRKSESDNEQVKVEWTEQSENTFAYSINIFSKNIIQNLKKNYQISEELYYNILTALLSAEIFNLIYRFDGSLLSSFLISLYFMCDEPFHMLIRSNAADYVVFLLAIKCFGICAIVINSENIFMKYLNSALGVFTVIIIGFIRAEAVVPIIAIFILSFFQAFAVDESFVSFKAFSQGLVGAIGSIIILIVSIALVIAIGTHFALPSCNYGFTLYSVLNDLLFENNHNLIMFPIIITAFILFVLSKQEGREYSEILLIGVLACALNIFSSENNQPHFNAMYLLLISMVFAGVSLSRSYLSILICLVMIPFTILLYFVPISLKD